MFKRFRDMFKPKEIKTEITTNVIPSLLDQQKRLIDNNLASSVATYRKTIDTAIENIQNLLETFQTHERDSISHPKLEKIAKTALPNFTKSMQQVLNRPLPSSDVAYYQEVSTMLKGVINLMKGTGRYLPAIFPDEMKEIRTAVNSFGKSINIMTGDMNAASERLYRIEEIRNIHSTFVMSVNDYKKLFSKFSACEQETKRIELRINDIKKSIASIEESQALKTFELERTKLSNLEQDARILRLKADHYIQPTLSVYRKALYVVRHQNKVAEMKSIENSIKLLESIPACQSDLLMKAIDSTIPHIRTLIDTGVLQLKNQDEIHLFSHEVSLVKELHLAFLSLLEIDKKIAVFKENLNSTPVHISYENLKEELHVREKEHDEQNKQINVLRNSTKELFHKIELLHEQLVGQISEYLNEKITLKPGLENLHPVPEK